VITRAERSIKLQFFKLSLFESKPNHPTMNLPNQSQTEIKTIIRCREVIID
jgi:hypothetical protein